MLELCSRKARGCTYDEQYLHAFCGSRIDAWLSAKLTTVAVKCKTYLITKPPIPVRPNLKIKTTPKIALISHNSGNEQMHAVSR